MSQNDKKVSVPAAAAAAVAAKPAAAAVQPAAAAVQPAAAAVQPAKAAAASTPAAVVTAAKPAETPTAVAVAAKPVEAAAAVAVAVAPAPSKPKVDGVRDRSGVVALIAKLRDPQAETARDAAITLGSLPADAEAVDALAGAVRSTDGFFHPVVRAAAAAALGKLGDRRAVDALIAGTRDGMAEASEESILALGKLGDVRARPALEAVVKNADGFFLDHIRKAAQSALARLA